MGRVEVLLSQLHLKKSVYVFIYFFIIIILFIFGATNPCHWCILHRSASIKGVHYSFTRGDSNTTTMWAFSMLQHVPPTCCCRVLSGSETSQSQSLLPHAGTDACMGPHTSLRAEETQNQIYFSSVLISTVLVALAKKLL